MGTCSETICKHQILFPYIQHLLWLPQGRSQGKQKCGKIAIFGLTHWLNHRITRKLLNIDRYMLQGVWQALNCLSIHATICKHQILFPYIQHLLWLLQGRSQGKQKCGKIAIFGLTHWLNHRKTRKLLNIDRYMLQGVWQALNCLSIHATLCVIIAGASPGETKMWAAVRKHDAFLHLRGYAKQANLGVSWLISTTVLLRVYQSTITNRKHAKRIQRDNILWPL